MRLANRLSIHPLILGVLSAALVAAFASPAGGAVEEQTACGRVTADQAATAQLHVVGSQMQDSDGNVIVPYGISIVSGPETTNWGVSEASVRAQIIASKLYWHANAVRIQVSQAMLFKYPTRGHSYDVPFAASVDRLVCLALRQHQIPILSENSIFTGRDRGPTELTRRFWRFMAARYGNRLPVIFDLFNEPQVTKNYKTGHFFTPQRTWRVWRDGGHSAGKAYLGMQALVDELRVRDHVNNVIWAEQPYYTDLKRTRLDLLATHQLSGPDIVYAFHKLLMSPSADSYRQVKAVADKGIPLVTSEWTQFAATDRPWMCQPDAYRTTPGYLAFMRQYSIGLLAWSLQPGALVKGTYGIDTVHDGNDWRYTTDPKTLAKPNEMKRTYGCTPRARGQGAGALIQDYFARYSVPAPAGLFAKFG